MKKVYIIDSFSFKEHHCEFNSAMMLSIYLAFNSLNYYADRSSFYKVRKRIPSNYNLSEIAFHSCFVFKGENQLGLYIRYFISSIQNIKILLLNIKCRSTVFFLSTSYLFMGIILKIAHIKNIKCYFICHGELECLNNEIKDKKGGKYLNKIIYKLFINRKKIPQKNIYFIVLGDSIKTNLVKLVNKEIINNIISIDHPCIFMKNMENKLKYNDNITISMISNIDKYRGGELIKIAKHIKTKKNITLKIVSRILDKELIQEFCKYNIHLANKDGNTISRAKYEKEIENSDFILFLYHPLSYKFTASGAIFEAMNNGKPIISFNNNYFDYIFKLVGGFGYLANKSIEIVEIINDLKCVRFDVNSSKKIRNYFSPENISKQIFEKCT